MRSLFIVMVISISLFSCKTITIDNEQIPTNVLKDVELINIPAGAYTSGKDNLEKYIYYDYEIMKYPVTNVQYLEFLKTADSLNVIIIDSLGVYGEYKGDQFWPPGYYLYIKFNSPYSRIGYYYPDIYFIKWRYVDNRKEFYSNHPITQVTWFGANAFAKFYGMRLPSKEEWEKAARANTNNIYPWGNNITNKHANFKNSGDAYDNDTTPIGYYNGEGELLDSYSPYGCYDMAGNVWEWTSSWWRDSSGKVLKGGSWNSSSNNSESGSLLIYELMAWYEPAVGYIPENTSREIGFRCVADVSY